MQRFEQLSSKLQFRGFNVRVFSSGIQAATAVYSLVTGHTVGLGGSLTARQIGIHDHLQEHARQVFWHEPGKAGQEERNALTADFFLASVNAISMDGHIVNIDGSGNRVAATCFGPGHLVYLVGKNKVVDTLAEARKRAKEAAVRVAEYYNRKTPCVITGKCEECQVPDCVCSVTVIHRRRPQGIKVSVFLIDEELGL